MSKVGKSVMFIKKCSNSKLQFRSFISFREIAEELSSGTISTSYSAIKSKLVSEYRDKITNLIGDSINKRVFYTSEAVDKLCLAFEISLRSVSVMYDSYRQFACLVHVFKYPSSFLKINAIVVCASCIQRDSVIFWDISEMELAFIDVYKRLDSHKGLIDSVCDSYIVSLVDPSLIIDVMRKTGGDSCVIVDYGSVDADKIAEDCSGYCTNGTPPRDLSKEKYGIWWARNEEAAMVRRQKEIEDFFK